MAVASMVEKATSDLLINPDWGRNLELCDILNNDPGQAKEVVKAAKKRLSVKNSTVQLLTLTLLETLIKNCGDAVHQQVAERDVLHEMVKIVKKKGDMNVRDKILSLLDSWQEAFGGQRGRYPQYFAAYDELRRSGVEFPQRENAVPIFTPPQTHPITAYPAPAPPPFAAAPGFGPAPGFAPGFPPEPQMPVDNSLQPLSLEDIGNARGGMEVLSEMLSAIDPRDKAALNEELIVELVEQCRIAQKQVMHLVNTTSDEALLFQALSLNDDLQKVLAKRDALASGTPVPPDPATVATTQANFVHDEDESEDDFSQLAHRPRNTPDPKPTQQQLQPVKLPAPPVVTKIPPPPGATPTRKPSSSSQAVDLLSGDMFGAGTQSAEASINHHPQPLHQQQQQQPVQQNPQEEDPDTLNPFALHHQKSSSSSSSAPQPFTPQQQALLYGSDKPQAPQAAGSSSILPPPPQKNSQRQQYFQQHHSDQSELASKTQKLSVADDDEMINPYAALYQKPADQTKEFQQPKPSGFHSAGKKPDSLFSDLVDFQSAKMKSGSG